MSQEEHMKVDETSELCWYAKVESPLGPGDRVLIQEGPLSGLKGIFERETSDAERVVVLLDTIQYQARVLVDRINLAAA